MSTHVRSENEKDSFPRGFITNFVCSKTSSKPSQLKDKPLYYHVLYTRYGGVVGEVYI